jgi:hypothetical protein
MGSNMADPRDVTQREAYIIAQALYEFIRFEQSKPRELRRWSDEQHTAPFGAPMVGFASELTSHVA